MADEYQYILNIIDKHKKKIPEGDYLEICKALSNIRMKNTKPEHYDDNVNEIFFNKFFEEFKEDNEYPDDYDFNKDPDEGEYKSCWQDNLHYYVEEKIMIMYKEDYIEVINNYGGLIKILKQYKQEFGEEIILDVNDELEYYTKCAYYAILSYLKNKIDGN